MLRVSSFCLQPIARAAQQDLKILLSGNGIDVAPTGTVAMQ
jgi:hypothetical protein